MFWVFARKDWVDDNLRGLRAEIEEIEKEMAITRAQWDALEAQLKAGITAILKEVADLKAQVAAGNPITQQDLDDLTQEITDLTGAPPVPPTP